MKFFLKGGFDSMFKNEIEINELNKLYDEIYYGNFDEIESALDILTNCISEKEYQEFEFYPKNMEEITDVIIELYDEVVEVLDDEGISEIKSFVLEKKDKILNREMDEILENEYMKYLDEDYDHELIDEDKEEYEDIYENKEYKENEDFNTEEQLKDDLEDDLEDDYNDDYDDY